MCLACVAMASWSQNLMLNQEEPEDVIEVVGYFFKNDTITYRQTHNKYKIQENDTTVSESYVEEFMIVVTDSTSDGYKMKYVPLSFTLLDADTVSDLMTNAMSRLMQSVVCEFTTDEFGSIKSITNWRKIRDQLKKGVKVTCDTLYATIPDLDSIMPRKSRPRKKPVFKVDYASLSFGGNDYDYVYIKVPNYLRADLPKLLRQDINKIAAYLKKEGWSK